MRYSTVSCCHLVKFLFDLRDYSNSRFKRPRVCEPLHTNTESSYTALDVAPHRLRTWEADHSAQTKYTVMCQETLTV
jgi:hypothetical protein